jgi:hypothetical protein
MKQTKRERIWQLLERGYSIKAIAANVKCTRRYVYMQRQDRRQRMQEAAKLMSEAAAQVRAQQAPSLWQRIKNFFKGSV